MKKIFSAMVVATALFAGYSVYKMQTKTEFSDITLANVEALASEDESSNFANLSILSPVECEISKVNGATAIIIGGVTIPAYAQYTVYGSKFSCEFNLFNKCDLSKQTLCKENN